MQRLNVEIAVGLFLVVGLLCFAYLAIRLAGGGFLASDTYSVKARFISISGLKEGAPVEIAGVRVGKVSKVDLDRGEYEAVVHLAIANDVKIQEDAIASIRTAGVIGDKYVNITPGGAEDYIEAGMEIEETESSISLEELVSKYIFESKK